VSCRSTISLHHTHYLRWAPHQRCETRTRTIPDGGALPMVLCLGDRAFEVVGCYIDVGDWMLFWQVDHRLNRWSNSLDWSNCLLIQLSLQQSHGLYHSPYDAQRTTFSSVALASRSSRPLLISCLVNTNTQVQHLSLYIPNWWCLSTATTCCRHHGHWPTSPSGQMTK